MKLPHLLAAALLSSLAWGAVAAPPTCLPSNSTLAAAAKEKQKSDAALMDRVLPEVAFDGVGLSDALDFMKDVARLKIEADWDAIEKAGVKKDAPVTVKLKNAKVSKALTAILDSAAKKPGKLVYKERDGIVHVAPK